MSHIVEEITVTVVEPDSTTLLCETHTSTDWEMYADSSFNTLVYDSLNDVINLTSITVNSEFFPRMLYIRSRNNYQTYSSPWSDPIVCYGGKCCTLIPNTITITINGYPNQIGTSVVLNTSPFIPAFAQEVHTSTDWIIKDVVGNIVWDSTYDTNNLTTITVPHNNLLINTFYTVYVKHRGNLISTKTAKLDFITRDDIFIETPIVTRVLDEINEILNIHTTPFIVSGESATHVSTDWVIRDAGNSIVFSSIDDTVNLTSIVSDVTWMNLGSVYTISVRHKSSTNMYSDYGEVTIIGKNTFNSVSVVTDMVQYSNYAYVEHTTDTFYTVGGSDLNTIDPKGIYLHSYSSVANKITTVKVNMLPDELYDASIVISGDKLIIIGGRDENDIASNLIYELDITNSALTLLPVTLPVALYDHTANIDTSTNIVYICGGRNDSTISDAIYALDLNTNVITNVNNIGTKLYQHTVELLYNRLYIIFGNTDKHISSSIYVYNIATDLFEITVTANLLARYNHSSVVIGDMIFIAGGRTNGVLNSILQYNISTGIIIKVGNLLLGKESFGLISLSNLHVLSFSGGIGYTYMPKNITPELLGSFLIEI